MIHERDRRTDGQTDRQTDRRTPHDARQKLHGLDRQVAEVGNNVSTGAVTVVVVVVVHLYSASRSASNALIVL